MDVATPDNLNIGFLREFMMLPTSYYETGAAIKFRKLKKFHDIVHRPEVNRDQPRGLVNCQHLNMFTPSPIIIFHINPALCCRGLHSAVWNPLH